MGENAPAAPAPEVFKNFIPQPYVSDYKHSKYTDSKVVAYFIDAPLALSSSVF